MHTLFRFSFPSNCSEEISVVWLWYYWYKWHCSCRKILTPYFLIRRVYVVRLRVAGDADNFFFISFMLWKLHFIFECLSSLTKLLRENLHNFMKLGIFVIWVRASIWIGAFADKNEYEKLHISFFWYYLFLLAFLCSFSIVICYLSFLSVFIFYDYLECRVVDQ